MTRAALGAILLVAGCLPAPSAKRPPLVTCAAPTVVTPPAAGTASWRTTKAQETPRDALPAEFDAPYRQPLSTLAWEDGIYLSRDGLDLYATYIPMDLLSAVTSGAKPSTFYKYRRGPTLAGEELPTTIVPPHPWMHADVAIAQRASTSDKFTHWCLSGLHKATGYDLGGFQGDLNPSGTGYDRVVYTDDEIDKSTGGGGPKIAMMKDVGLDPSYPGLGAALPSPLNTPGIEFDNPHVEKVGGTLVLFFDSADLQGVTGGKHVFFSTSADGGASWSAPVNVTSVNDAGLGGPAQQPHLYFDGTAWWIYFTAPTSVADPRLSIFRAKQTTAGDWNSFGTPTQVVGPGTAAAVGEPTLDARGDLSFVVITTNHSGTATDTYDADPWFMAHK